MSTTSKDLRALLQQLKEGTKPISTHQLFHLSDLAGERLGLFWNAWETLQASERRRLANSLLEMAEASFQVNYDAIFKRLLDDPDAEVRAVAIDGLWENEEVPLAGILLNKLERDPSAQVRASAATGLGRYVLAGELDKLEEPIQARITTELLTVLRLAGESIEVRRRAIESVSYSCTPEILQAIEDAYYDDDEQMRISAVLAMGRSCDKRWKKFLLEELESDTPAMRYEAAWACGELALAQAVPILARLIEDADRQVRYAAIWALGQIGGSQAHEILLEAYEDADQDTVAVLDEALAEQVLAEGSVELMIYDLDIAPDEELDDDFYALWSAEDDGDEDYDEDWDPL
jgi:hypothetical protein